MADISAKDVMKLREITGAGMMDCKKALVESEGDMDKAVEYLRAKGQKVSEKRADRETSEGAIFVAISPEGNKAAMVELNCETDFVARAEDFVSVGQALAKAALAANASTLEQVMTLSLDGKPLADALAEGMSKMGEKLEVKKATLLEAEKVVSYLHIGGRVGVLVGFSGTAGADIETVGKDVAMQIAAMNPMAIDETGIPEETKEREKRIALEQMQADPANAKKPADILEKIVVGKVQKYLKENTLIHQEFVKDPSQTVEKYLASKGANLKVVAFTRFHLGA
jgi:elongation factor Ts